MKIKTLIKGLALTALLGAGTVQAADATMGGQIPLNSTVIIYPERLLDFSATATLLKMAEIIVTNNAPGFKIKVSFASAGVAFSGTDILKDMALGSNGATSWGTGLSFIGNILDSAVDATTGGSCAVPVNIDIDPLVAADAKGNLKECVNAGGAGAPGEYVSLAGSPITIGGTGGIFATQTAPTTNASIRLLGSWDAGVDNAGARLLAGTYSATMSVTLESNY